MRKILILPLAIAVASFAKTNWKPLFDGHSFKGWHILGDKSTWTLGVTKDPADSSIIGFSNNPAGTAYSMLFSDDSTFDQFTVKYKYRLKAGCSGFFFRSHEDPSTHELVTGCQVEAKFQDNIENQFGNIYCWPTNEWQTKTTAAFWKKAAKPIDQYQEVVLTIKKPFAYVNMNGFQAVGANATERAAGANDVWNYSPARTFADKPGRFAMQIHNGQVSMDVAFKDIFILEGCGDSTSANFDGGTVTGLTEQPAVYANSAANCAVTGTVGQTKADLRKFIGPATFVGKEMALRVDYPGANTLEIVSVKGKVVFSGSSPTAIEYHLTTPSQAGIYFAKIKTKTGIASQKIIVP
jgi:hypothetical protein